MNKSHHLTHKNMPKKNLSPWIWIAVVLVVVAAILAIIYGRGRLNLGALTQPATCPNNSQPENSSCFYNLELLSDYYVSKDGSNFVISGPTLTQTFTANNWSFQEGTTFNAAAYSVVKTEFTPITLTFKFKNSGGKNIPSLVFDYPTAQKIQQSKFIEVSIQDPIKVRFIDFNIPDKTLHNQ